MPVPTRARTSARRAWNRFVAATMTVVAVTATLVVVAGEPAGAQQTTTTTTTTPPTTAPAPTNPAPTAPGPPTTAPPALPDPASFAALAAQVSQNQALLTQLAGQVDQATKRLADLAAAIADTQQQLDAARTQMAQLKQIVRSRAAYIYTHAQAPQIAVADIQHVEDITSGKKYAESATFTDGQRIADLSHLAAQLATKQAQLEADRAQQQKVKDTLVSAQAGLLAVTARQKKLLDEVGAVPLMGDAQLTAKQITDWFNSRNVRYRLAGGMSIADLIQIYMEEGAAEHVRPELAFAQAIIETGSFGDALDNNYAGIGACDSCTGEPAFPTPRDGVRGQIQLLRNYGDPTSRAANLKNPPSPTIYGNDPVAAAQAYDTFFAKGKAPTWNVMGNGNWATDPGYAQKVLTTYFQMVAYAAQHES